METQITIFKGPDNSPVVKSLDNIIPMPAIESTMDGKVIGWPMDQHGLYLLYQFCSEHMRCCQIKSEASYGAGVTGTGAEIINNLLPDDMGPASFMVSLGLDLEVYGNAFAEIVRAGSKIIGLRYLPARTMYVHIQGGYMQWVYAVDGDLTEVRFAQDEILHLKMPCPAGFHYSLPTWIGCHEMIELVFSAVRYNSSFFQNRAIPDYAIIAKGGQLGEKAKTAAKEFFQNEFKGVDNAHRALYMTTNAGTELEFKKLTEDRKDADFLKLLDSSRERIITAHGVPPRMLGIVTAGALGGGGEVLGQMKLFERTTCVPRRRRMAEQWEPVLRQLGIREQIGFEAFDINLDETGNVRNETPAEMNAIIKALGGI